jgi:hypothetical protein
MMQSKFNFDAQFMIYGFLKFEFIFNVDDVSNFCAIFTNGTYLRSRITKKFTFQRIIGTNKKIIHMNKYIF